jgi:RNA polymerase sigma factor (sigma-70 family)
LEQNEQELIKQCILGDQGAIKTLIQKHQLMVYTLAYQILKDHHQAEDLTQETFVHVLLRLNQFRGDSKFSSWLYKITYRFGLNFKRDLKKEREELIADVSTMTLVEDSSAQKIELREEVEHLLQKLSGHDRLVMSLFYLEGYSIEEVAKILELSISAVKVRLHRVRNFLHEK